MTLFRKRLTCCARSTAAAALLSFGGLLLPASAQALYSVSTVAKVTAWQDDTYGYTYAMIGFADGNLCYLNLSTVNGKSLFAMVEGAYLSNRPVEYMCNDAAENIWGVMGHKLTILTQK